LRNRKRRIVRLKSLPDLSNRNVVLVKTYKDLENVNEYKNINFVEIIPNKLSVFFITDNGITYVYNLDAKKVK
ncbi:MAG: hypothetical protein K6E99_04500, partial [Bacilli bacterium]|nr:hypothetical protein [Bacilli bacterium]